MLDSTSLHLNLIYRAKVIVLNLLLYGEYFLKSFT